VVSRGTGFRAALYGRSRWNAGARRGNSSTGGAPVVCLRALAGGRRHDDRVALRSVAQPLNPDNEHKLIRGVHQERSETLMMSAEMQCAQGCGRIGALSGVTLVVDRIDNDYRIHKRCQQRLRRSA
jgi:hypothetical protein